MFGPEPNGLEHAVLVLFKDSPHRRGTGITAEAERIGRVWVSESDAIFKQLFGIIEVFHQIVFIPVFWKLIFSHLCSRCSIEFL